MTERNTRFRAIGWLLVMLLSTSVAAAASTDELLKTLKASGPRGARQRGRREGSQRFDAKRCPGSAGDFESL